MLSSVKSDTEIALMDIDRDRLAFAKRACEMIVERGGYPAKVTATLHRKTALKNADGVGLLAVGLPRLSVNALHYATEDLDQALYRHQLTRRIELDLQPSAAHGPDPVGQALSAGARARKVARPGSDHLPLDLGLRFGGLYAGQPRTGGDGADAERQGAAISREHRVRNWRTVERRGSWPIAEAGRQIDRYHGAGNSASRGVGHIGLQRLHFADGHGIL